MNVVTFANRLEVKIQKDRHPYYMNGSEYFGKDNKDNSIIISYGLRDLMGGYYAECSIKYKGKSYHKTDKAGFGSTTVAGALRNLGGVKDDVFNQILKDEGKLTALTK